MIAIARMELGQALRTPPVVIFMFVVPALLIAFAGPGVEGGTAQAYAGMTTIFLFFAVGQAGFSIYREHGWGTWARIQTTPTGLAPLVAAKLVPYGLLGLLQFASLLVLGRVALGIDRIGSLPLLAVVAAAASLAMVGLTLMLLAVTSDIQVFTSLSSMLAILLGGLAGGFSPADSLPGWVQALARVTPQYWAIQGIAESMGEARPGRVLACSACLAGFGLVFALVGAWRFDLRSTKRSYGTN